MRLQTSFEEWVADIVRAGDFTELCVLEVLQDFDYTGGDAYVHDWERLDTFMRQQSDYAWAGSHRHRALRYAANLFNSRNRDESPPESRNESAQVRVRYKTSTPSHV